MRKSLLSSICVSTSAMMTLCLFGVVLLSGSALSLLPARAEKSLSCSCRGSTGWCQLYAESIVVRFAR